jgi:hypothetical protein
VEWHYQTYVKDQKEVLAVSGLVLGHEVCLMVSRREGVGDMMLNKNKFFDKHPTSLNLLEAVTGRSILFD